MILFLDDMGWPFGRPDLRKRMLEMDKSKASNVILFTARARNIVAGKPTPTPPIDADELIYMAAEIIEDQNAKMAKLCEIIELQVGMIQAMHTRSGGLFRPLVVGITCGMTAWLLIKLLDAIMKVTGHG